MFYIKVDGQSFEGSGASKKLSKQACARAALTKLYNISFTPLLLVPEGTSTANMDTSNGSGQELVPGKNWMCMFELFLKSLAQT